MRVLYTSDLHGSPGHYAKLLAVAESFRPELVVLGGDLFPDDSALEPQRLGHGQPEYIRTQFRKNVIDLRQCSGCQNVLMIFGNHDWGSCVPAAEELVTEGVVTVLDLNQSVNINGLNFLGYPYTPPTPWFVKDFERLDKPGDRAPLLGGARWDPRFSRPVQHGANLMFDGVQTIAEDLADLTAPDDPWVFVVHAPPHETHLDRAYGNKAYGSRAIREAIERHQPLLSLHGHIHESPTVSGHWRDKLGRTIAVNPGQSSQHLSYVTVEIDVAGKTVSKLEFGQQS
ncbi:MAG: metallophosphoesterase [Phycisphaerales bacterium]|nr:metallophosphoesterase [Phycisphaerales bacterium]